MLPLKAQEEEAQAQSPPLEGDLSLRGEKWKWGRLEGVWGGG